MKTVFNMQIGCFLHRLFLYVLIKQLFSVSLVQRGNPWQ
ncbi:Uncharacterized protein dnm_003600 [Desulfonema magnum]|uniref:Uncharacterized protein n=1 Tax=Desulfonema magnum TaxID=45655 RepID=A0A975BFE2_9BACT|nr:Uncharacterized protein dnm_003600 [Desulfonema magnum]